MCQIHIFEIEKKVICNFESFSQNENNLQIERPILHLGSISWLLSAIPSEKINFRPKLNSENCPRVTHQCQ